MKYPAIFLLCLALTVAVTAQDNCSAFVTDALLTLDTLCDATRRNELCYGNTLVMVTTNSGEVDFSHPGDIIPIQNIASVQTSPFAAPDEWGIALMRVQANIPDSLPGRNITFLLFGDVNISSADSESSTPMQVIYFTSGIGEAGCNEAPQDGLIIQAPKHDKPIELTVNGVKMRLGSTVYLQAEAGEQMVVYVLEGQIEVSAFDVTQTVPQGAFVTIPIDDELKATDAPGSPEPYTTEKVALLPVDHLPQPIVAADPATPAEIEEAVGETTRCIVTARSAVNLRGGPGTIYTRVGGLGAGESAAPDAHAPGSDGFNWWHFPGGAWVREDVVEATGKCESLPVTANIPPTPTPAPVQVPAQNTNFNRDNAIQYLVNYCTGTPGNRPLHAGQNVYFQMGCCGQATAAENDAMTGGNTGWISLDGVMMSVSYEPSHWVSLGFYTADVFATWVATSGTHTVAAGWRMSELPVCTFTVD